MLTRMPERRARAGDAFVIRRAPARRGRDTDGPEMRTILCRRMLIFMLMTPP